VDKRDFRILVADDDDIARDVVNSLLTQEGYPVVSANDGFEAIKILTVEDIRLVITDLKMPGASGIDVLRHAMKGGQDTAVIIITAYGTLDTTLEAIKEGAFDYLTKPFKIKQLLFAVRRAHERAALLIENRELRRFLRDTYRDFDLMRAVVGTRNPELTLSWMGRMDRLAASQIMTSEEVEIMKRRILNGNGKK
jgi:DNA-binding NtrC family response regulator